MTNPLQPGQWIQWSTPDQVKRGEVLVVSGPSIEVRWLGGGGQVFPVVEGYFAPYGGSSYRMEVIPRPRGASSIDREQQRGRMSVARAAAILGTDKKRIRALLRSGALEGVQVEGKWTQVDADGVEALSRA